MDSSLRSELQTGFETMPGCLGVERGLRTRSKRARRSHSTIAGKMIRGSMKLLRPDRLGGLCLLVGFDDFLHERMAHDVSPGEVMKFDARDIPQDARGLNGLERAVENPVAAIGNERPAVRAQSKNRPCSQALQSFCCCPPPGLPTAVAGWCGLPATRSASNS